MENEMAALGKKVNAWEMANFFLGGAQSKKCMEQ